MKFASLAVAAVAAAIVAMPAHAVTYNSQAAFTTANPGLNLASYSGLTGSLSQLSNPFTIGGVTATGLDLYAIDTAFWGSVDSLLDNRFGGFITLSFAPSNAVGFYVAGSYGGGTTSNITVYNGASVVFSGAPVTGGVLLPAQFSFWGIDGVGPITSVTIASPTSNDFISVAEIQYGTGGVVPEPASWALMIAGFGMIGAALRRRKVAAAA